MGIVHAFILQVRVMVEYWSWLYQLWGVVYGLLFEYEIFHRCHYFVNLCILTTHPHDERLKQTPSSKRLFLNNPQSIQYLPMIAIEKELS